MQTDLQGQVTRTVEKSFNLILFAPALQAFIAVLMGFVYWMMLRTPPVIDPDDPQTSSAQNAMFRRRWSAFIVFSGMLLLLVFLFMQLEFTEVLSRDLAVWLPIGATGLMVIAAIVLSIKTGQSGNRIRLGQTKAGAVIRRDDDKYWKWGAFYVNKDDPSMFVEKRFGVGFTINFGRPAAIAIFFGVIALIIASVILSTTLAS